MTITTVRIPIETTTDTKILAVIVDVSGDDMDIVKAYFPDNNDESNYLSSIATYEYLTAKQIHTVYQLATKQLQQLSETVSREEHESLLEDDVVYYS